MFHAVSKLDYHFQDENLKFEFMCRRKKLKLLQLSDTIRDSHSDISIPVMHNHGYEVMIIYVWAAKITFIFLFHFRKTMMKKKKKKSQRNCPNSNYL